jgi:hypothetical protein
MHYLHLQVLQKKDEGDQSEILKLSQRLLVLKDSVNKLRQENNVRELQKDVILSWQTMY